MTSPTSVGGVPQTTMATCAGALPGASNKVSKVGTSYLAEVARTRGIAKLPLESRKAVLAQAEKSIRVMLSYPHANPKEITWLVKAAAARVIPYADAMGATSPHTLSSVACAIFSNQAGFYESATLNNPERARIIDLMRNRILYFDNPTNRVQYFFSGKLGFDANSGYKLEFTVPLEDAEAIDLQFNNADGGILRHYDDRSKEVGLFLRERHQRGQSSGPIVMSFLLVGEADHRPPASMIGPQTRLLVAGSDDCVLLLRHYHNSDRSLPMQSLKPSIQRVTWGSQSKTKYVPEPLHDLSLRADEHLQKMLSRNVCIRLVGRHGLPRKRLLLNSPYGLVKAEGQTIFGTSAHQYYFGYDELPKDGHFVATGKIPGGKSRFYPFSFTINTLHQVTIAGLNMKELKTDSEGRFTIGIGPKGSAAEKYNNFLDTSGYKQLYFLGRHTQPGCDKEEPSFEVRPMDAQGNLVPRSLPDPSELQLDIMRATKVAGAAHMKEFFTRFASAMQGKVGQSRL